MDKHMNALERLNLAELEAIEHLVWGLVPKHLRPTRDVYPTCTPWILAQPSKLSGASFTPP